MIVWKITGNEIGPNGNGARFFAKKKDAESALRDHRADKADKRQGEGPDKIEVKDRDELVRVLHDAMGYRRAT
jgi:hypothetical protein